MFIGASIEGTLFSARNEINMQFYGRNVSPSDILNGQGNGYGSNDSEIIPPVSAQPLYDALIQVTRAYTTDTTSTTTSSGANTVSRHRNRTSSEMNNQVLLESQESPTINKHKKTKKSNNSNSNVLKSTNTQQNGRKSMRRTSILI